MKLSAPVYVLKDKAKKLKRAKAVTMTQALDDIARAEGFTSWSLLSSKLKAFVPRTPEDILIRLCPGDLLLVGARPGLGKTTFTLQLLLRAVREGRQCYFFSLEWAQKVLAERLKALDEEIDRYADRLDVDLSDEISSQYIIERTKDTIAEGALIAIDYLQLLDQKRSKPPLQTQVEALKAYAEDKGCIVIFISQIDRSFVQAGKEQPGLDDVRLPNPLDLTLFNKSVFVQDGRIVA